MKVSILSDLHTCLCAHAHVSNHVKYTDRRCPDQFSLQYNNYDMCIFIRREIHLILVCTKLGGRVVHSFGNIIPHEFPITDVQQISGPDEIGWITCTVSRGTARFITVTGGLDSGEVTQAGNVRSLTTSLRVNTTNVDNFNNGDVYCNRNDYYFYLFLSSKCKYIKQCTQQHGRPTAECELYSSGTGSLSSGFSGYGIVALCEKVIGLNLCNCFQTSFSCYHDISLICIIATNSMYHAL